MRPGAGETGAANGAAAKKGEDLVISVPRGTLLRDAETGRLVADLSGDEPQVIAHGGRGGWGNSHFATPTRQGAELCKARHEGGGA